MMCLRTAALSIMDGKLIRDVCNNVIVPDWNDLVKKKHSITRQTFHDWCLAGKPNVRFDCWRIYSLLKSHK